MPFRKGDFILIEYTAKVKETGEIFDTTNEEIAKRERLHKEGEIYEPKLIVIGERWILEAIDDKLPSFKQKSLETIEIPPERAFGSRVPEKVKMVPLRRLRDKGITPQLGMRIEYEKKLATIRTIGAGRVTLDFNPPLAGKTLTYEMTIMKRLRTKKEKILALIHRRIPVAEISKDNLEIRKTDVRIQIPEEVFYIEGLQLAKRGISADIQRFFSSVAKVEFLEIFMNPRPQGTKIKKGKTGNEKQEMRSSKKRPRK